MQLTAQQIRKVAELAKLELSDGELDEYATQLGKIVTFVEKLNEISTDGVEEMAHPMDVHTVLRHDTLVPGLSRSQALANAPSQDDEFFRVPAVMAKKS